MNEDKKFLKVADKIIFKSKTEGLEYNLESGKVYTLEVDRFSDEISLKTSPDLTLPSKVYDTVENRKFINKVLNSYKHTENTLGVMLAGMKGSGKTITSKIIAKESKLPILVIDKGFRPSTLNRVFKKLESTEVCVLMDEIDKLGDDYDNDYLLRILDGVDTCGKKMFIFTANEADKINKYLKDRCSRIRYWREFDEMSPSMIKQVLTDRLVDKKEVDSLSDFIQLEMGYISFDNVCAFVDEVNANPKSTYEELFEDMNLSVRN